MGPASAHLGLDGLVTQTSTVYDPFAKDCMPCWQVLRMNLEPQQLMGPSIELGRSSYVADTTPIVWGRESRCPIQRGWCAGRGKDPWQPTCAHAV